MENKQNNSNYNVKKKCRYEKFKAYFQELERLLPYKNVKSTQKTILLDTAAYIKALESELGLINESDVDWEKHYKQIWCALIEDDSLQSD